MQLNRTLGLLSASLFLFAILLANAPAGAQGTITASSEPINLPTSNTPNTLNLTAVAGPGWTLSPTTNLQGSITVQGTGQVTPSLTALQNGGATLNTGSLSGRGGFAVTTFSGGGFSGGTINLSGASGLPSTGGSITLQASGRGAGIIAPIVNPPILPQLPVKTETTNSAARFTPVVTPQTVESAFPNFGVPTDRIMWGFKVRTTSEDTKTPSLTQIGRVLPNMVAENGTVFSLRHDGSADYKVSDSTIDLTKGSILLVSQKPTEVRCGDTIVSLDSGSAVEISVSPDGLYVRTLMNDHNHGVAVKIGEEVKHVGVGSELCVAADQQGISDILRDRIPRRDEYWQKLPNGKFSGPVMSRLRT